MVAAILVLTLRIILMLVLFSFLGWTIYTLWKDLRLKSFAAQIQKVPAITLIERSGVNENKENTFSVSEITIGREAGNTLCLDDDIISNRHASLTFRNGHWWIEDLYSTNGTYLNDEKVSSPTILITGDDLHIGNQFYEIRITENQP
ncbi:MAG: FHA domain-containing protein [Ignavibacteriaceae bacterium]|jgi:pSer/pThr/pTyr-binding forkhead associated (FHA) protein|nr:FHA domain-containing protein [Ignavibacteriaceae bacterium]